MHSLPDEICWPYMLDNCCSTGPLKFLQLHSEGLCLHSAEVAEVIPDRISHLLSLGPIWVSMFQFPAINSWDTMSFHPGPLSLLPTPEINPPSCVSLESLPPPRLQSRLSAPTSDVHRLACINVFPTLALLTMTTFKASLHLLAADLI